MPNFIHLYMQVQFLSIMAQVSNNQQKQEVARALFEADEGVEYIGNAQI